MFVGNHQALNNFARLCIDLQRQTRKRPADVIARDRAVRRHTNDEPADRAVGVVRADRGQRHKLNALRLVGLRGAAPDERVFDDGPSAGQHIGEPLHGLVACRLHEGAALLQWPRWATDVERPMHCRAVVFDFLEMNRRRLSQHNSALPAARAEATALRGVACDEAGERAALRAGQGCAVAGDTGAVDRPGVLGPAAHRPGLVEHFAPGPGHIDTAPKLVQQGGDAADGGGEFAALFEVARLPQVVQRHRCVEEMRLCGLPGCTNLADAGGIAAHGIHVVVLHILDEATTRPRPRRGDERRLECFQPLKCRAVVVRHAAAARATGKQRLKQARRARRPFRFAVVATVMETNVDRECAAHRRLIRP